MGILGGQVGGGGRVVVDVVVVGVTHSQDVDEQVHTEPAAGGLGGQVGLAVVVVHGTNSQVVAEQTQS